MSFFSKLFHKDKEEAPKEADPNVIELPCGKFLFADDDEYEIGYEAEIDWYEKTNDIHYYPVGVFIEVDIPGTRDASLGLERFTRLYDDRKWTDYKVKLAVTEHYLDDNGTIVTDYGDTMSKDEFMEKLKINYIAVYRSGKIVYSLDFPWVRDNADEVVIIYDENDKTTVMDDSEYHKNFLSLIFPERVSGEDQTE